MDDLIIRITDNSGEDRGLDSLMDDIRKVAYAHDFKLKQWGTFDSMARSMTLESKFIEELLERVEEN